MKFTVECNEIYDFMGFALLTISLAMEYYRRGLELCGGGAPGVAAALAIAMLIKSWVDENTRRGTYQTIVAAPGKMITAVIPIQTRPSRCL